MQIQIEPPTEDTADAWKKYIKLLRDDKNNVIRKQQSKVIADFYKDKQEGYLIDEMLRIYNDDISVRRHRKWTQPVTRFVVDSLATTYSGEIKREISFTDQKEIFKKNKKLNKLSENQRNKIYASEKEVKTILEDKVFDGLNTIMAQANKHLISDRTVLLWAYYSQKEDRIKCQVFRQYQFDLVYTYDENQEKELFAVIFSEFGKAPEKTKTWVYTVDYKYEFLGDILQGDAPQKQELGFMPFVIVNELELDNDEDYLDPGYDLVRGNQALNFAYSDLLHLLHRQSHGILTLTHPTDASSVGMGMANPTNPYGNQFSLYPGTVNSNTRTYHRQWACSWFH